MARTQGSHKETEIRENQWEEAFNSHWSLVQGTVPHTINRSYLWHWPTVEVRVSSADDTLGSCTLLFEVACTKKNVSVHLMWHPGGSPCGVEHVYSKYWSPRMRGDVPLTSSLISALSSLTAPPTHFIDMRVSSPCRASLLNLPCIWTTVGDFGLTRVQTTCTCGSCFVFSSAHSTTNTTTHLTGHCSNRRLLPLLPPALQYLEVMLCHLLVGVWLLYTLISAHLWVWFFRSAPTRGKRWAARGEKAEFRWAEEVRWPHPLFAPNFFQSWSCALLVLLINRKPLFSFSLALSLSLSAFVSIQISVEVHNFIETWAHMHQLTPPTHPPTHYYVRYSLAPVHWFVVH